MSRKKAPILPVAMLVAGIGAGNMTAQPEVVQLPAPEPVIIKGETVEVPVRFEDLHHKADKSLREALKLPEAINSDIVALVAQKDAVIDKLRTLAGEVAKESEAVNGEVAALRAALAEANRKISAADDYRRATPRGQ